MGQETERDRRLISQLIADIPLVTEAEKNTPGFHDQSEEAKEAFMAFASACLNFVRDQNDSNREDFLGALAKVGYGSNARVAVEFTLNLLAEDRKRVLEEQAYITRTREGVEQS